MNCPHCDRSISFFSRAVMAPAKPSAPRRCPHCNGPFSLTTDMPLMIAMGMMTGGLSFFVLRPIPYVGAFLWILVPTLTTSFVSMRAKKFDRAAGTRSAAKPNGNVRANARAAAEDANVVSTAEQHGTR